MRGSLAFPVSPHAGPCGPRRRRWLILGIGLSLCWLVDIPQSQAQAPAEFTVKARMVLSLARFVQWPAADAADGGQLRLCVAARQPEVISAFAGVHGQSLAGRLVQVKPVSAVAADGPACHVLFVHGSAERPADVLAQAGRAATLTVGDAEGFLNRGGMVELMLVNDAIRFDVSLRPMRAAQLVMSSQALRLARQVRE